MYSELPHPGNGVWQLYLHSSCLLCFLFQAFLTPSFLQDNPDSVEYVEKLKDLIVEQVRNAGRRKNG